MVDPKMILGAFTAILVSLIGASVIGSMPDPNREVINALPNTTPDVKTPANAVLDVKDKVDTVKDTMSMYKNLYTLMLGLGIPSAVIGGLVLRARSG